MKEKTKRKLPEGCLFWLALIALIITYQIWNKYETKENIIIQNIEVVVEKTNYDICIDNIKNNEKFVDTVYSCPAGYPTIGYGHMLKRGDKFNSDTKLTETQADSLLKSDFDLSIREAYRITGFTGDKCLALGHFFFCMGTNKYGKSRLRTLLTKEHLNKAEIEPEWLKWCNYKDTNGVWHEVELLKKARQFEVDLFFGEN